MSSLSRIVIYPIKSLDPVTIEEARITDDGGVAGDRSFAIVDSAGRFVNGKRTADVHRVRTDVDLEDREIAIGVKGQASTDRFHLDDDRDDLDAWLSAFFGEPVRLVSTDGPNMTDRSDPGPTLVSAATLETVASWFPGIDAEGMRRRLRPNLVVDGVPAFWEDRLVGGSGGRVRIGDVVLEGCSPIPRCVVPSRDPDTGEEYAAFRETFVRKREESFPDHVDADAFDHYFAVTVGTHAPPASRNATFQVGDRVAIDG